MANGVVVTAPSINLCLGMAKRLEPAQVHTSVMQFVIEGFRKGVLNRFSRLDKPQLDAVSPGPRGHDPAGAFGAIVQNNFLRPSKPEAEITQITGHTRAENENGDNHWVERT